MQFFLRSILQQKHPKRWLVHAQRRYIMSSASTSALLYAATVSTSTTSSARPDDDITKGKTWHVKSGGFNNPWPSWHMISAWTIVSGMMWRKISGKANKPDSSPPTVPVQKPTFLPTREQPQDSVRATWLGHACFYVEYPSGLRILFDPVFTDRCSPLSFLGPKRYTEMPCQVADIPIIDAVVVSHNHYDHLSRPTVRQIAKRHPNCHFFVPLRNKEWFQKCGIDRCTELDWWEEIDLTLTPIRQASEKRASSISSAHESDKSKASDARNAISCHISCLPSQHHSNRGFTDRAATLWASWAITSGGKSVYFAGDTGYRRVPKSAEGKDDWSEEYSNLPSCPAFKDIGQFYGPFDLGLIPIGAYEPRWIMSPMHSNPRDAVEIFRDTKCKRALGIHWGTWVLTEEDVLEPPQLLKKALTHYGMSEEGVFDVCDIGESREY